MIMNNLHFNSIHNKSITVSPHSILIRSLKLPNLDSSAVWERGAVLKHSSNSLKDKENHFKIFFRKSSSFSYSWELTYWKNTVKYISFRDWGVSCSPKWDLDYHSNNVTGVQTFFLFCRFRLVRRTQVMSDSDQTAVADVFVSASLCSNGGLFTLKIKMCNYCTNTYHTIRYLLKTIVCYFASEV